MCFAIPGKVIEIGENRFIIEYPNENRIANFNLVDGLKIGDFVIVNNKVIINKIPKKQVRRFFKEVKMKND